MTTLAIKMVFGFIRSRTMAGIVCVLLCLGLFYWLFTGPSEVVDHSPQKVAEQTIQKLTTELERRNPEAAAELAKIQESRNRVALAATLKTREQLQGIDGLARLSSDSYDLRLAEFAAGSRFTDQQQRSGFILAHGIGLQHQHDLFNRLGVPLSDSSLHAYFETLEKAAQDDNQWSRVRENPIMVFLMQQNVEPELLDFYNAEKDWMDDVLFLVLCNGIAEDGTEFLTPQNVLRTLQKNHPHFKTALNDALSSPENDAETTVCTIYALYANYGDVFRYCVDKGLMPVSELLEVVFANWDYFDKHAADKPDDLAKKLITIRDSHPAVWTAAKQYPLCLELYERLPDLANSLCEKYGHDDIATFLFTKYDEYECVPAAAAAIDKFGDLAIYILNRYENSEIFRTSLKNDSLGVRIIPYVAKYEDGGLAQIEADDRWLNKYFDINGNEKDSDWWVSLPGGGAVKVAENWVKGYPNEWSELGWAALDVADATLLVVSLGSSAPASATKTGTMTTAKVGSKAVVKELVKRSTVRMSSAGTRAAAHTGTLSLFRRVLTRSGVLLGLRTMGNVSKVVLLPMRVTGALVVKVVSTIYSNALKIRAGWAGLQPSARRAICRGLFYTGLAVTIVYRTIPMLKEKFDEGRIGEDIGKLLALSATELAKTTAGVLDGFLREMLGTWGETGGRPLRYFLVAAVLGIGIVYYGRRSLFPPNRASATG